MYIFIYMYLYWIMCSACMSCLLCIIVVAKSCNMLILPIKYIISYIIMRMPIIQCMSILKSLSQACQFCPFDNDL